MHAFVLIIYLFINFLKMIKKVVFIDGVRTPFLKSGTDYMDLMSYQLGQFAIKGLLDKTGIDPNEIDRVILGNVISNVKTENVAREAAVTAGVPIKAPANTVKQACISANQAISNAMDAIQLGRADVIISGGTECTSDTPIGYTKEMRKKLFMAQKLSTPMEYLKFATTLRPNDFLPDKPAVAEYITGRTMGNDCEILAQKFGVTREEQDILATASHQNAAKAFENGNLDDIISVQLPPKCWNYYCCECFFLNRWSFCRFVSIRGESTSFRVKTKSRVGGLYFYCRRSF